MHRQRRALDARARLSCRGGLIPEPTANTLSRAYVGVMWFRLRVRGVPVHVAYAQTGTNAILSAYALIQEIQKLTAEINERAKTHPWFKDLADPIKFNPGVIRGGDWGSSTPAWCEVDCRIGLLPGTTLEQARCEVTEAVARAAQGRRIHGEQSARGDLERVSGRCLRARTRQRGGAGAGRRPSGRVRHGSWSHGSSTAVADTRMYGVYYGIPALCYGPMGERGHGFDERANLANLKRTTLAIAAFIADWCGTRPV